MLALILWSALIALVIASAVVYASFIVWPGGQPK